MFKDKEMQRFFSDLVAKGTDSKTAISLTVETYKNRCIVEYEFEQFKIS